MAPPVNILGSRRGPAAPGGGGGGSVPSNTVAPTISGTAQVGATLSGTDGTWTNSPTSFDYRWQQADDNAGTNTVDISGSTSVRVSTSGELAKFIRRGVRGVNGAGAGAWAYSAWTGPVAAAPTGTLSTTFEVTSSVGGTSLPFAFGHAFKQGDVGASQVALASGATAFQCSPTSFWPDGSVRHAIIAGRVTCTANTPVALTLTAGADPGGTALSITDLKSAIPASTSITVGGTTMTLAGTFLDTPHRTVCAGPVMSNWIYRLAVSGNAHLVIWADVRLYAGGAVEIFPWVENCYTLVASPGQQVVAASVVVGGTTRFTSASVTLNHHTRIPLVDNTAASFKAISYWSGTDPQIVPRHNPAYLQSTKMVPQYGWTASTTALNALVQSYSPGSWAGVDLMNTSGGASAAWLGGTLNQSDPCYVTTGDARAFNGVLAFALAGGSWDIHYRAEAGGTQATANAAWANEPLKFSQYPQLSINVGSSPAMPANSGPSSNWGATGSRTSHQISRGYLAWIVTGRWWFLDETVMWAVNNYLYQTPANRGNAQGFMRSDVGANTDRGAAWGLRTLAQALAILPSSHPCYSDLVASWEANTQWYTTAISSGAYANSIGIFPPYMVNEPPAWSSSGAYGNHPGYTDIAGWMQMMIVLTWGQAWDLALPQSGDSSTRHVTVRDHGYKFAVGLCGDGSAGQTNWRWFGPYDIPVAVQGGAVFTSWEQAQAAKIALGNAMPTGNTLYRWGTSTAWSDPVFLASYYGQHLAALAAAVDHFAPGASAAWSRVTGASNYASYSAGFADSQIYGIIPRTTAVPAWASGQAVNTWRSISGSAISLAPVMPQPAGTNWPQGKVVAWNGWHADTRSSRVYSVANGGHDDYHGNEVTMVDLSADAPAWSQLVAPSLSSAVTTAQAYYSDGKPASRHSYYTSVMVESLDRALMLPGGAQSTNGGGIQVGAAFNLQTGAYDSAATWSGLTYSAGVGEQAVAKHPTTENVFIWNSNKGLLRWTKGVPGTITTMIAGASLPMAAYYTAAACDPTRGTGGAGRVLFLGGGLGGDVSHVYDIGANTLTAVTLSDATLATSEAIGLVYVQAIDKFVARKPGSGGAVSIIDPATWAVTTLNPASGSSIPDSSGANSPYTRFLYLPALGGIVFGPNWTSNLWFLKLH